MVVDENAVPHVPDPEERILDALLAMVVVDGHVDPDELQAARAAYAALTGHDYEMQTLVLRGQARLDSADPGALPDGLDQLDDATKRQVLAAALSIAQADGFVLEEEEALLDRITKALGLPGDALREASAASG